MKRLLSFFFCVCLVLSVCPSVFAEELRQGRFDVVGSVDGGNGCIEIEMTMPEESIKLCGIQLEYTLPSGFSLNGRITTSLKTKSGSWNVNSSGNVIMLENNANETIETSNSLVNGAYRIARIPVKAASNLEPDAYEVTLKTTSVAMPADNETGFIEGASFFETVCTSSFDYVQGISSAKVSGITDKDYNGSDRFQDIELAVGGKVIDSINYGIDYKNNRMPGLATMTITGYGNYSGSITKTFYIYPKQIETLNRSYTVNSVSLSFDASPGCDGYYIYRSFNQSGGFSLAATLFGSTKTSWKDSGLTSGTQLYYRVVPFKNANGKRLTSRSVSTFSARTSGYSVGAVNGLKAKNQTTSSITLSWNKVDKANGYIVWRASAKNASYKAIRTIESGSIKKYTDKKLQSGKAFYYKVTAYRTYGSAKGEGKADAVDTATKPKNVTVKSAKCKGIGSCTISFKKTAGSGYQVYYSTSKKKGYKLGYTGTSASPKIRGLRMGKRYYFKVRAFKTVGNVKMYGEYSKVVSSTVKKYKTPAAAKLTSAKNRSSKKLKVTWKKAKNANGYEVYYSTAKNSGYKKAYSGKAVSCNISSLQKGKTYYVRVRSYISAGGDRLYGKYSKMVSVKVNR